MAWNTSGRFALNGTGVDGMSDAVFDSNILIDYLNHVPQARQELLSFQEAAISVISWIEVMAGAANAWEERDARRLLQGFTVIEIDDAIRETTVIIRRDRRMRLPDAIILATAETRDLPLVTRNAKDFNPADPRIRIPYQL